MTTFADTSAGSSGVLTSVNADRPLVSVILCVYNGGSFLRAAVDSVLAQTYRELELIVVDDGSTDDAVAGLGEVDDARLRVIRQPNAGKPTAMNRALGEMRGEFYAIQDADDVSHPRRIERQVEYLRRNPEISGAFCGYDLILDGRHVAPRFGGKTPAECAQDIERFRMPGHDPTAMYRWSEVAEQRYDPELRIGEGLDYILRVGERGQFAVCEGCLYSYRVDTDSLTKQDPRRRDEFVRRVLRRASERRGADAEHLPDALTAPPLDRLRRRDRDNNLAAHFIESVLDHRAAGLRRSAIRIGLHCVRVWPWTRHYWKALVYALIPIRWVSPLRRF